jgi:putative tricarboxylic transport membrane protein
MTHDQLVGDGPEVVEPEPNSLPASDGRESLAGPVSFWLMALGVVLLSIGYLWQVLTVPEPPRTLQVPVGAYPTLVAGFLIGGAVTSSVVLVREARRWRCGEAPESTRGENQVTSPRDLAVGGTGMIGFIVLMPSLGYVFCAAAFVICVATYFAPKKVVRNVVVGVVLALSTYALFDYLGVRLPQGIVPLPLHEILPY